MKKILAAIVIVLIAVGSVDPYCNYSIEKGFSENKPDKCLSGALLKQRMFNYRSAISTYKKIIKVFPDFEKLDKVQYQLANCYEKDGNAKRAIETYQFMIDQYPESQFIGIASKKMSNLKANSETDDI